MHNGSQRGAWMRKGNKPSPAVYRLSTLLAIAPQMTTNRKGTRYQAGRTFGRFAIGLDISTTVAKTVPIKEPNTAEMPNPTALITTLRIQLTLDGKQRQ